MAWGGGGGGNANSVEAWEKRLLANDPTFTSLHILSFRRITSSELGRVFAALHHNTTLQELYASGHPLDSADDNNNTAAKTLALALEHNRTLKRLNVGHDQLGSNEVLCKILAEGLRKNMGLERLDLENKGLGGRDEQGTSNSSLRWLAEALAGNQGALKEVNIARNKLTDRDMAVVCEALAVSSGSPHGTLQKLDLSLNAFGEAGTRSIAELLARQVQGGLTEIDLSDNEITEEGGRAIGRALETNTSLQRLRMSACMDPPLPVEPGSDEDKIRWDDTVQVLNRALTQDQILEIRTDGDAVLESIAQSLGSSNQTLQELWMDDCNISSVGATYLADALRHNRGLVTVRMRNNQIGNRGARALGAALCNTGAVDTHNTTLKNLELGSNKVGVLGWHGLVIADALESLGLYENQISVLHEALEEHHLQQQQQPPIAASGIANGHSAIAGSEGILSKLAHLDVGCNGISREDYTQLGVCLIKGLLPSLIRLEIAGNGDRSQVPPQQPGDGEDDDQDGEGGSGGGDDEQSAWERLTLRIEEARPNLAIHWKGAGAMQQQQS
ncbi:Leucine-rich repeat-containing protein 34 [Dissophora globulifera]|nr:Leucine-rich repeat-containing protein 34 [Dissophora globulifera]